MSGLRKGRRTIKPAASGAKTGKIKLGTPNRIINKKSVAGRRTKRGQSEDKKAQNIFKKVSRLVDQDHFKKFGK